MYPPAYAELCQVILPLCLLDFLSAGTFAFTLAQNEFLYTVLLLSRSERAHRADWRRARADPRGAFYWGHLMAGALLGFIPVALIYSFFVKYYVAGFTAGAVKG